MTPSRWLKILALWMATLAGLALVLAVLGYWLLGDLLPSFPEALFGQVTLARETRPPSPQDYQSAEFLLGQISAGQIEQAEYIALGEERLFWDPYYVGFARTALSGDEVQALQDLFRSGHLFQSASGEQIYPCLRWVSPSEPRLESCPEGEQWMNDFTQIKSDSQYSRTAGAMVIYRTGGQVVEIQIFRSPEGTAYEARETGGTWWLIGITTPSALIDEIAARVKTEPVPLLWPEMTAERANARAERIIGPSYPQALDAVHQSAEVQAAFGEPLVLRPAQATNIYAGWMDSVALTLTLSASGPLGEGAVLVRGFDTFTMDIVSKGKQVEP